MVEIHTGIGSVVQNVLLEKIDPNCSHVLILVLLRTEYLTMTYDCILPWDCFRKTNDPPYNKYNTYGEEFRIQFKQGRFEQRKRPKNDCVAFNSNESNKFQSVANVLLSY